MLRETVVASVALAIISAVGAALLDQALIGIGIAVGLILGSANGFVIARLYDPQGSFVGSSLARLSIFSASAIGLALLVGGSVWTVLIGIAAAQLVMVAAGVREGLRTAR
jgi:hypothetical protein